LRFRHGDGIGVAFRGRDAHANEKWNEPMNLEIWIPTMVTLGLVTLGLMFAFVIACDKV